MPFLYIPLQRVKKNSTSLMGRAVSKVLLLNKRCKKDFTSWRKPNYLVLCQTASCHTGIFDFDFTSLEPSVFDFHNSIAFSYWTLAIFLKSNSVIFLTAPSNSTHKTSKVFYKFAGFWRSICNSPTYVTSSTLRG